MKTIDYISQPELLSENKMNIRYRTENFSGSMVRDAASVMAFETFELGNIDILEYLRDNFLKEPALIEKTSGFIDEISENGYVDDLSEDDRIQFFHELLNDVEKETGVSVKYALWLTDLDSLTDKEHFYGKDVDCPENIDSYEVGPIILSELDCDGTLYGYTVLPQCLEEKIEFVENGLFDVVNKKEGDSLTIQEKIELDELCSELESNIQEIEKVLEHKNLVFSQSRKNENSLSDNTSPQENPINLDDKLQNAQARVQEFQSVPAPKTNERSSER